MEDSVKYSFSSAEIDYPIKLFLNKDAFKHLILRDFKPIHIQLCPTNLCNFNCEFCSCADRDRKAHLPLDRLKNFYKLYESTIQATTITGGGEPLMYPHFEELVQFLYASKVDMGLISNGVLLPRIDKEVLKLLTWTRISLSDRSLQTEVFNSIDCSMDYLSDLSFSLVCGDIQKTGQVLKFVIDHYIDRISHVRVINDLFNLDSRVSEIKKEFEGMSDKLIFQDRNTWTVGCKDCLIALVKPIITADGRIQPCCGVQYAIPGSKKEFLHSFDMGTLDEPEAAFSKSFDGSKCKVCYYNSYNKFLRTFLMDLKHSKFV